MYSLEENFYELDNFGFTTVKKLINPEQVEKLNQALDLALKKDREFYGSLPQKDPNLVPNLAIHGPEFLELLDNDIMHAIYNHYLTDTSILYTYSSTNLQPREVNGASKIHVDMPRWVPNYHLGMSMCIALDDFTEENGATLYLPGSHRCEKAPSEETFNRNAVLATRKAGDALVMHPRTFHKAGFNKTNKVRRAISTYAVRSYMKPRFDFPRMLRNTDLSGYSERVRRFLGFHTRVPSCMEEFFVEPEKRIYKANQG